MTVAPIRREILVETNAAEAFTLFTEHIGAWWPLRKFSVYEGEGTVAFEGEQLVERKGDETSVWAETTGWEPPSMLRMNWHPGGGADKATDVTVTFTEQGDKTLVRIEHARWEAFGDNAAAAAEEYGNGWPAVLDSFGALVASAMA